MIIITLEDQLEWAQQCLDGMMRRQRPENEIRLQSSVVGTLRDRIREKRQCAYCYKEREEKDLERATITFRTRVNGRATLGKATNWYCKDTKCAVKDQMAHEG